MRDSYTSKELSAALEISERAVQIRSNKETWSFTEQNGRARGGKQRFYPLATLPADVQAAIMRKQEAALDLLPALSPAAALAVADEFPVGSLADAIASPAKSTWSAETAVPEDILRDERVRRILKMIQEAEAVPRGWQKRKWIETVAQRHKTTFQTIYRHLSKYQKYGLAGLQHTKSTKGSPQAWSPAAIDYWVGLCLKKEHRKIAKDALYEILRLEARAKGWQIGCYESALWWYKRKITPQLLALQRGGLRALDNTLPPILRDYSDLDPFEILVGDQHRFDFWVVDDDTGEVFRPEGYFWQDLRSRVIYGGAVDKKYDAWMIGLALKIGIQVWGAFGSIYTDNGRPELSRHIMGVLADMRSLGLSVETTTDVYMDLSEADPEEINPRITMPGSHRKAIVKNAKAKMIEGTFCILEGIMRDHFRLPGYVKLLGGDIHENDVDQAEVKHLAETGRLPLFSEFVLTLYRAIDYYNKEKAHRGVLEEWAWKPRPKSATPFDCLRASYYMSNWRPRRLTDQAVDLIFLAKESRMVDRGRIKLNNETYEHDALVTLKGKVDLRYNPMAPEEVHVFRNRTYICTALPVEYSSMKDLDLAKRKIIEKRERRKLFCQEFRRLTSSVPDFREYSQVPQIERVAAVIGEQKQRRIDENRELYRERTAEELAAEVAKIEEVAEVAKVSKVARALPERPAFFLNTHSRYEWCVRFEMAGGELTSEDLAWKQGHEATMTADQLDYWETVRSVG